MDLELIENAWDEVSVEGVENLIQLIVKEAEKSLPIDGTIEPFALCLGKNGIATLLPVYMDDELAKRTTFRALNTLLHNIDPFAAIFVSETWMVSRTAEQGIPEEMPSEAPDKREALLIAAEWTGGSSIKIREMIRTETTVSLALVDEENGGATTGSFGAFAGVFNREGDA